MRIVHYFTILHLATVLHLYFLLARTSIRLCKDPSASIWFYCYCTSPTMTQTALDGRAQEAVFAGIAPQFAAEIMLFNSPLL